MRLLIQRVSSAKVEVDQKVVGEIEAGVLVFIGITHTDQASHAKWLAHKLVHLRIFEYQQAKMNQSLFDQNKSALIISQFTLYGDCAKGRRPSFIEAAQPTHALPLYQTFIDFVREAGIHVQTGLFGADMKVSLLNEGPVTILLEKD